MQIINVKNNAILADKAEIANNPLKRMKGLLGKSEFSQGSALILDPCDSVHTFFMRFAIDIIFIDKNNSVVKIISSMKPYRLSGIYFKSRLAIELPSGKTLATNTQLGDKILIK